MRSPNHSIQRMRARRSGCFHFSRHWRRALTADAHRWMQSAMKKIILVFFASVATAGVLSAGEGADLSKIDHFSPKGRAQDKGYNPHLPVIDALIKKGTNSIPLLVGM